MKTGFIGFGHLGRAIAGRLMECGHSLVAWNRTFAKMDGLDVEKAVDPAAVAAECKTIFCCLFDSAAVAAVLDPARDGLLAGDIAGKTIVDLSTNHFADVERFHTLCAEKKAIYLEAPVLGSVEPAKNGELTILVSGENQAYEKVRPILEQLGRHIFYLGESGQANKMKLINNLTLASFMATLAEAVALAEKAGLAKERVLEILSVGGGRSLVLSVKKQKLLDEEFSAQFSSALLYKDLHYLHDLAFSLKTPLFTGSVVKELYARTYEQGLADEDISAIYKVFRS